VPTTGLLDTEAGVGASLFSLQRKRWGKPGC